MVRAICTPSSKTLAKMNDEVSLLTNFSELKFDHRFGCPFDRYGALQRSQHFELFSPLVTTTLAKPHDRVPVLTNFLIIKLDYRFRCAFGR